MQRMMGIAVVLVLFAFLGWAMSEQSANATEIRGESEWTWVEPIQPYEDEELEEVELPSVTNLTGVKLHEEEEQKVWSDIKLTDEEQIALWDKCKELGINYWFILALCESESSFRSDAVGDHGNSIGYMQINKVNWKRMQEEYGLDVNVPLDNLLCGAVMFAELANKYDTIERVVMSYKCGESRAKKLLEQGVVLNCVEELTNRSIELENAHR